MFNRKQIGVLFEIIIALFECNDRHQFITRALIDMRESNYMLAITFWILLGDDDLLLEFADDIMSAVRLFVERLPSDSVSKSDSRIRGLHNALEKQFGDHPTWKSNAELIDEQNKRVPKPLAVPQVTTKFEEMSIHENRHGITRKIDA